MSIHKAIVGTTGAMLLAAGLLAGGVAQAGDRYRVGTGYYTVETAPYGSYHRDRRFRHHERVERRRMRHERWHGHRYRDWDDGYRREHHWRARQYAYHGYYQPPVVRFFFDLDGR